MSEITSKLRETVLADLKEYAADLEKAGTPRDEILRIVEKYLQQKKAEFYKKMPARAASLSEIYGVVMVNEFTVADSKAEVIFYKILEKNKIEFKFQYKIGPYRADYLIDDDLIVELDGPQHATEGNKLYDGRRDAYLEKMGYRVVRYPIWMVSKSIKAVIEDINERRIKKRKTGTK
jgi:very-short-patch-repair endonuclease